MMVPAVSVLILTRNEAPILGRCLASVGWSDDIVVFDSFSTDRTLAIAQAAGARVVQRSFDNYGAQREAARRWGGYKHPWVFALDADEQPDAELALEIKAIASAENTAGPNAYRMRRKDHFRGRWLPHSTLYPSWFIRLYRPGQIQYEARAVHEYPVVHGRLGELNGHLVHDSFSKGDGAWWEKHKRYAVLEARENVKSLTSGTVDWKRLIACDPVVRRRALKELSVRLPCRPMLRFIYMYGMRGGFLEGMAGFEYCRLLARYEQMIVSRTKKIRRRLPTIRTTHPGWTPQETKVSS